MKKKLLLLTLMASFNVSADYCLELASEATYMLSRVNPTEGGKVYSTIRRQNIKLDTTKRSGRYTTYGFQVGNLYYSVKTDNNNTADDKGNQGSVCEIKQINIDTNG
jgi:hypothetical protein